MEYIAVYLLIVNIIAIVLCFADKLKSKKGYWRIPEKTLFAVSFLGGSVGMYGAMLFIRHKTKHKRFMIGLPIIILIQAVLLLMFLHIAT